jgi:hypothetical protein
MEETPLEKLKSYRPMKVGLALAVALLTISVSGCTNARRKSPNLSQSRVLVTAPLLEGVFTITTASVPSGTAQMQVNFSSTAGQPSLLNFCSGTSEPIEGGAPGETRACACSFTWNEINPNNGTAIAYTRTAYSDVVQPVQAYRGVCPLPIAWTSGEITDGTRVKVKVVPGAGNPLSMTMDTKEVQKGTELEQFDFSDSEGRGFVNIHRYACFQKPPGVGYIRSKVPTASVARIEPSRYSLEQAWQTALPFEIRASSATDFCIGGRDPAGGQACANASVSRDVGAQSFYFSMFVQSPNIGRISFAHEDGQVYCPAVRETLRGESVPSAWPLDTHFALAKSKSAEFSIPIEARAVLNTADPNTKPNTCTDPTPNDSEAAVSSQCMGWASKPNADGTCNAFRDQSGTMRQTYRLRRYIARMPDRFLASGKVDRKLNFDEIYVLDRPVNGSPDPLKPYTMAGPKPCPYAYYDHSGVTSEASPLTRYTYSPYRPKAGYTCDYGDDGCAGPNNTKAFAEAPENYAPASDFNGFCDRVGEKCEIPGCRYDSPDPVCRSQVGDTSRPILRLAIPGIRNPARNTALNVYRYDKQLYGQYSYTCRPGDTCISLKPFEPNSPTGGSICLNIATDPRGGNSADILCKGTDAGGEKAGFVEAVGLGGNGDGKCDDGEYCIILNRTQLTPGGSGGLCRAGDTGCHALGIPGYRASSNACWKGKNPDNAHFPNFDAFLAGISGSTQNIHRQSCSATMPIVRFSEQTTTPNHLILSTTHRSNPHVEDLGSGRKISMHTVYRRPIDPHWITYTEDHEFQACAPLSQASSTQDILDPPLHFAKDTKGNVSWCAMSYPTRNEAVWEIDTRPGAAVREQSPGYVQNFTSPAVKNSTSAVCGPTFQALQNLPSEKTQNDPSLRFYPKAPTSELGACQLEDSLTNCDGGWLRNFCKGAAHHPPWLRIDTTVDQSPYPFGAHPDGEYTNPVTGDLHKFIGANNACNRTIAFSGSGIYEYPLQAPPRDIEEVLRKDPSFNCTVTWDNNGGKAGKLTPRDGCCNRSVVPGPNVAGKSRNDALRTDGIAGNPVRDTAHLEPDQLCGRPNYE